LRNGDVPETLESFQDYNFEGTGMSSGMLSGGAGIYIRKDISYKRRHELEKTVPFMENRCESVFVELQGKDNTSSSVIGEVYKADEVDYDNFMPWLTQVIGTVSADDNTTTLYITGKFNIDILSHSRRADFVESLGNLGCRCLIKKPNLIDQDSLKIIDQIITNLPEDKIETGLLDYDQLPDCLPIYMLQRRSKEEREKAAELIAQAEAIKSSNVTTRREEDIIEEPFEYEIVTEEEIVPKIIHRATCDTYSTSTDDQTSSDEIFPKDEISATDQQALDNCSGKKSTTDELQILDICSDDKSERDLIKEMQMIMMLGKEMSNIIASPDDISVDEYDSDTSIGDEYTDEELAEYFTEQCSDIKNDVMREFVETDDTIIT